MAKEFDNTNRGALFKNNEKAQPNHADYQGNINVGGQEFWLNAWLKESKAGDKYMSLSVKPKEPIKTPAADKKAGAAQMDSDIPFAPIGRSHAL